MTYQYHDCEERGCHPGHRASHQRTMERHRRSAMGKILRAGPPKPSVRALPLASPLASPLPPGGFEHPGLWINEVQTLPPIDVPKRPFDPAEYQRRYEEQFDAARLIREAIRELNERLLAQWSAMLERLPDAPAGMEWHPVLEPEDVDALKSWDIRKTYTMYRLRAELRDV